MANILPTIKEEDLKIHEVLTCAKDVTYIYVPTYSTDINGEGIMENAQAYFLNEKDALQYAVNDLHRIGNNREIIESRISDGSVFFRTPYKHWYQVKKVPVRHHL